MPFLCLQVNGERKAVPYSPNQGINITPSGRNIVLSTMFGLMVSFDGYHYVKVSIPDGYKRKMTGICGNLDGISSNDYITKDGASTQSHAAIGNSWAIQDPTEVLAEYFQHNFDLFLWRNVFWVDINWMNSKVAACDTCIFYTGSPS